MKTDKPKSDDEMMTLWHAILQGDEEAARQFVARYHKTLLRAIRCQLDRKPRTPVDPEDVAQATWKSIFRLASSNDFDTPEKMEAWLCEVARNKARMAIREQLRDKRDCSRQVSLDEASAQQLNALEDHHAGPAELAASRIDWQDYLQSLPANVRQALRLLGEGHGVCEVASRVGVDERTILR
jgi:RNA polymerase sigma factor (sigma-70 family)